MIISTCYRVVGAGSERTVRVSEDLPEDSLVEMQQAQAALRFGLDRARNLVRDARREIAWLAAGPPEPSGTCGPLDAVRSKTISDPVRRASKAARATR
jgi:hypothetical protein